jgi:hypothetical protein
MVGKSVISYSKMLFLPQKLVYMNQKGSFYKTSGLKMNLDRGK